MPLPTVTIVTPSFNQAKYLEATLRSVASQRTAVHEYFVLDGGSTDGSADLIRRYDGFIDYWTSEKDKGQSDAIRRGFERATGDFLFWLNSDDVLMPGVVAKVRQALADQPDVDVITGYHAWIDADDVVTAMHRSPRESAAWARWGVLRVAQPTCFFRRSLYEKIGGVRLDLHCVMDHELWFRMFDAGVKWARLPQYVAGFRVHEVSKGSSWKQRYDQEYRMMDQEYPRYRGRSLRHRIGPAVYRATRLLNGEYFGSAADTKRAKGRKLTDVFGDWKVPALQPA